LEKNKHLIHVYPPFKDDSAYSEGDDATILSTEEWEEKITEYRKEIEEIDTDDFIDPFYWTDFKHGRVKDDKYTERVNKIL